MADDQYIDYNNIERRVGAIILRIPTGDILQVARYPSEDILIGVDIGEIG